LLVLKTLRHARESALLRKDALEVRNFEKLRSFDLVRAFLRMARKPAATTPQATELRTLIQRHAHDLSEQLQAHQRNNFPPSAEKSIRLFSPAEAAKLVGIHEGYLRQIASEGRGIAATVTNGRRSYSVEDIQNIRRILDQSARGDRRYLPHRIEGEHLQIITVMNFKGGSGKTTTSAHLSQYLALHGYRVLAIDLDPQASLSALFGSQPELDVGPNETLYGAIRYDEHRRSISEVVRGTY
jgi:chromosome partitioning protein